ncbi:protein TIFY 5A [Rhodamnia argentea]|uniref:Protein TIFY 5A n=1 Tax=Rhodamnia argentea TaxID=178133 RepID=A0A8B8QJ42_9MYRT|nr:protein TIFY 5A [Rhodamnia argentea]
MGKNCNLDLHLLSSISSSSSSSSSSYDESSSTTQQSHLNQQQLAILYKGRVRPFDLTEFQARAIIWLASREVESSSPPPLKKTPLWSPSASGLSMKRSLQRFLQERRKRARAMSPYISH